MLHLTAEDEADLQLISAQMQDALIKRADLRFDKKRRRFALLCNRFAWDAPSKKERRRTALRFDDVTVVRSMGLGKADGDAVLSLLAISAQDQSITLAFSAGIQIRLEATCINATLDDLGAVWEASSVPRHEAE